MKLHKKAKLPNGFSCISVNCGIKEKDKDLSVFFSTKPAHAFGMFTKNKYPGVPVLLGREIIKKGILQAVVVNSKISNVGTGQSGIDNAKKVTAKTAEELGIPEEYVIMGSTGVIAKQLPVEKICHGLENIKDKLQPDPLIGAKGIMTTDSFPKAISIECGNSIISVVAKGSGMIEPNMATMLAYIFTDAEIEKNTLQIIFNKTINKTFNRLSIDSDTSTSDTCLLLANGMAGNVNLTDFEMKLEYICLEMVKLLARDGEGATKLLIAGVEGARNETEALIIAKSIVNSPLVKTMAYGADPNIGRVLMAVGKCFTCSINKQLLAITIQNHLVFANEQKTEFAEDQMRKLLNQDPVVIHVNLNIGLGKAICYGCDLTEGYIKENASYYSS